MTHGKKRQRALSSADVLQDCQNATLHNKLMILDWYHANGRHQSRTAAHFREHGFPYMKQPLLSAWHKDEANLRACANMSNDLTSKHVRTVRNPDFEKALIVFVQQAESRGLTLSGDVIQEAGTKFYDQLKVPKEERQKLSNGWLDSFKARVGLQSLRFHGEAASANIENVEEERARVKTLLSGKKLCDIFNMDETALFYAMTPDRGLVTTARHGVKQSKIQLTLAFTANADGTERLTPLIIGHAKQPRCFQKKTGEQLGFKYQSNSHAWMTADIFQQWLVEWNHELRRTDRKILLLVDNFSGHNYDTRIITNIRVERFAPNLTAHVQPMDAGIIQCFKAHYRRHFLRRALDLFDDGAADIYAINQLQAMRLIGTTWEEISNKTIAHCWNKASILPDVVNDDFQSHADSVRVVIDNQKAVLASIEEYYQEFERIQPNRARLSVEELVTPADESDALALESLDDNEIVNYVVTNRELEEDTLPDNNGPDEEQGVQSVMSTKDAIIAITNLERFMELENGKEFRNASCSLAQVKRTLHKKVQANLEQTTITSFFSVITE